MKALLNLALAASFSLASAVPALAGGGWTNGSCKPVTAFAHKAFITTARPDRLNVILVKQDAEPVQVRILNAGNEELFRTRIKDEKARLPINLAGLERGTYKVELSRAWQTETETFELK